VTAILLDTEAFIWWDDNDPRLGGNARVAIQNASDVYVSAASAWEIAIKASLGKWRTTRRPMVAVEAVRSLPRHHRDPFDRLIIAAARVEGWTVLTSDARFAKYDIEVIEAHT
jgi:PIN domain nuclease of toxin-antitoxin system